MEEREKHGSKKNFKNGTEFADEMKTKQQNDPNGDGMKTIIWSCSNDMKSGADVLTTWKWKKQMITFQRQEKEWDLFWSVASMHTGSTNGEDVLWLNPCEINNVTIISSKK